MMRVAWMPYLNCEPFYEGLPSPAKVLFPRQIGQAMVTGEVDAAPLSMVDCFHLEKDVERLSYGIAARRAQSVCLFSQLPISQLDGATILQTAESATSVKLLRVLLRQRYGHSHVHYTEAAAAGHEAVLLIGDSALQAKRDGQHAYCYDLGEEWSRWTGLPFTFAAWAVRRAVPPEERADFSLQLQAALTYGGGRLRHIARRRTDVALSEDEVVAYLRGFTYALGPREERAIGEFRKRLDLEEASDAENMARIV